MKENRNKMQGSTTRKHYWQSLEEKEGLVPSDWHRLETEAPARQAHDLQNSGQVKPKGMPRRDFFKFMGAGALLAGAACRRPTEQIVPAVMQPPEYVPGNPLEYATTAPDGSGLLVKTREGRPVFLAGNPGHPMGSGASSYNTAALMDLYDPDRARRAFQMDRKSGQKKRMDAAFLATRARNEIKKGDYVLLTGPIQGPSTRALIKEFLVTMPGGRHVELRPDPALRQIKAGQEACYGQSVIPNYRIDRADLIVSIDGDFLGTLINPTMFQEQFGARRNLNKSKKSMNRLVSFESMFSLTGANADRRYAIRPGDQALIALSIAAFIEKDIKKGNSNDVVASYYPSRVAEVLDHSGGLYKKGNFEKVIQSVATDLWNHRGRSLVIGGSSLAATGKNAEAQIAINYLNSLLDNDGTTVDYGNALKLSAGISDRELAALLAELKGKRLILAGTNPVFHLPDQQKTVEALAKIAYIVALNDRIDESSRYADVILPTNHFLESWGDSELIDGIYGIQQPVIRPLHATKSLEDRLIELAGGTLGGSATFYEYLRKRWSGLARGDFNKFWISALQQGYFAPGRSALKGVKGSRNFRNASLSQIARLDAKAAQKPAKDEFVLGMYYNPQIQDGSGANNAYRQELPDPVTKIVWDNYLVMSPLAAKELGFRQGDIVSVSSGKQSLKVPIHLQPGINQESVLLALGYGRSMGGLISNGVGVNALSLAREESDSFKLSGLLVKIEATGDQKKLASTQSIYRNETNGPESAFWAFQDIPKTPYRGSSQYDRPIVRETDFSEYKTGQFELKPAAIEYVKDKPLYPKWNFKDTRWHMSIDLTLCTGCSACITACNIENNIPMVGQEQVRRGREMHWLRVDRYFSGGIEDPEVAFHPMLCQHCENAPCENVCPVAATTHNSEGLNVMTYNRCIGTRYCANNCPYKVRRFNWHENWYYAEGLERHLRSPQELAMNPDVTTRSRGVMEKCSFCIQRIARARQESRLRGEKYVADGDVKTACQDVCPTGAIEFGNSKNPDAIVSKRIKDSRSYQVLDFLDVRPSVTYLAKIRNKGKGEV
ncbi:MAG: 4Fe-4S dicluster domain-containing protein [Leptospiraceae bacterium]|nr:4Fe-4S dicluster domain-containing protein [Leptospiraceae bacterium]